MMKRERKERKKNFERLLKRAASVAAVFLFFFGGFSRTVSENRVFRGFLAEISGIV